MIRSAEVLAVPISPGRGAEGGGLYTLADEHWSSDISSLDLTPYIRVFSGAMRPSDHLIGLVLLTECHPVNHKMALSHL